MKNIAALIALAITNVVKGILYGMVAAVSFQLAVIEYAEAGESMIHTFSLGIFVAVVAVYLVYLAVEYGEKVADNILKGRDKHDRNNQPTTSSSVMSAYAHDERQYEKIAEERV